ncbi:MAG TPA: hypothetical protein VL651_10110 [Bacteroidia bacterium]|jgi:hypothetical protein|nr:hypothetical protein [Bacteroidia bacterium]
MKKILITSAIVACAMIGFIFVLCILPCNGNCGGHDKECMYSDGGGSCSMDMDSGNGGCKMRKEVRVIMNDGHGNCQMNGGCSQMGGSCPDMNGGSCPKDKGSCNMNSGSCNMGGDHMMMGGGGCCCCCCMMMMHNGGGMGMCPEMGDSMKCKMKMDSVKKPKTK